MMIQFPLSIPPRPRFFSLRSLFPPTTGQLTMALLTRLSALSLFSALAVATPFSPFKHHRDLRVHETRDLPIGFSLSGPAAPSTPLSLRIALSTADPSAVVDALQTVSDPTSDKYGQYLSKAQVRFHILPRLGLVLIFFPIGRSALCARLGCTLGSQRVAAGTWSHFKASHRGW